MSKSPTAMPLSSHTTHSPITPPSSCPRFRRERSYHFYSARRARHLVRGDDGGHGHHGYGGIVAHRGADHGDSGRPVHPAGLGSSRGAQDSDGAVPEGAASGPEDLLWVSRGRHKRAAFDGFDDPFLGGLQQGQSARRCRAADLAVSDGLLRNYAARSHKRGGRNPYPGGESGLGVLVHVRADTPRHDIGDLDYTGRRQLGKPAVGPFDPYAG